MIVMAVTAAYFAHRSLKANVQVGRIYTPKEKPRRYARGRLTAFEAERPGRLQVDDELEFLLSQKRAPPKRGSKATG